MDGRSKYLMPPVAELLGQEYEKFLKRSHFDLYILHYFTIRGFICLTMHEMLFCIKIYTQRVPIDKVNKVLPTDKTTDKVMHWFCFVIHVKETEK